MDKSSGVGKLTPLLTQGAMENVALKVWLWEAGPASHLGRARGLALVVGKQKGWLLNATVWAWENRELEPNPSPGQRGSQL